MSGLTQLPSRAVKKNDGSGRSQELSVPLLSADRTTAFAEQINHLHVAMQRNNDESNESCDNYARDDNLRVFVERVEKAFHSGLRCYFLS